MTRVNNPKYGIAQFFIMTLLSFSVTKIIQWVQTEVDISPLGIVTIIYSVQTTKALGIRQ